MKLSEGESVTFSGFSISTSELWWNVSRLLKFSVEGVEFDSVGSLSGNYFSEDRVEKLEWSIPRHNNETRLELKLFHDVLSWRKGARNVFDRLE